MPEPIERIYDLAQRALDEQERQLVELRARLPPVVAAGGLGLTLLLRPVFGAEHPSGTAEAVFAGLGIVGTVALVAAAAYLLRSRPLAFSADAEAILDVADERGLLHDAAAFDEAMARALRDRRAGNAPIVRRLHHAFDVALFAMVIELGGFGAAAALAS